ncbi:EscR/YscR/HrcR family type III secretion system export apparatus protein [Roseateles depolymerans]|uniref:Type III secretion apparatus protein n=1 Tax=Roseateles depolymerans TaxID=76731 RepID=A0A0U3MLG8_9BURK|nr:EscR/YscR/HrcR family type III secretion system export apparatus protein [Roseateles depolymerans]ALV08300.1 Type III secretion apparatus protein [Roseateles depolymerans]REG21476.1 type III secretion protein R [Roseateles depolymerans]
MNIAAYDPVSLVLLLAGIALLPLLMVCTTAFLKISMVLMIVRNALGVQQVPPGIAVNAVALAATLFVMAPIFNEMAGRLQLTSPSQDRSGRPSSSTTPAGSNATGDAGAPPSRGGLGHIAYAAEPLREFMLANTLPERRQRFVELAQRQWKRSALGTPHERDYVVLIPCFVVSEMEMALKAGFVLYVPFVVIDLLLSNLLLALGMQMVSPMVVSLPLKLLLFVVLDGWTRLFEGLVASYA